MARVSTYLNFRGTTEEAFLFYREAFGTEFLDLRRSSRGDVLRGLLRLAHRPLRHPVDVQLPRVRPRAAGTPAG